ncbi:MAG: helix-turn-helix domain-containing protein [Nocardioides sp.]
MATPEQVSRRLAAVVSTAIQDAKRSQRSIAEETGIPIATLSRRLTGHSPFTIPEVAAIADAIGVSVIELVLRAERSPAVEVA